MAFLLQTNSVEAKFILSFRFNCHFFSWTWVRQYQNVSILDFIGAKDDGGGEW